MRIVALDTAGPVIGLALGWDGVVLTRTARVARGAETLLIGWLEALLAEVGGVPGALDGVAVTDGPGAFTGLRVGLATATGLAMACDVPLWATGSLDTRAARIGGEQPVLALLDARKGKVYAQVSEAGRMRRGPEDVELAEAISWMGTGFASTGEGAVVHRDAIVAGGGRVVDHAEDPAVDTLVARGLAAFGRGEGGPAHAVRPRYVRAPDAKRSTRHAIRREDA